MSLNSEIAKNIGIKTEISATKDQILKEYSGRWFGADYRVRITSPSGVYIHEAHYNDPDNYDHIIDHCVSIGAIPNWERMINEIRLIRKQFPEIVEYL